MAGRNRKSMAARHPNGSVVRAVEGPPPAEVKRIIKMAKTGAADPILATTLGWIKLSRPAQFDAEMMTAGLMYAQLRGRYDRMMGMPRRTAASPSYERGFGKGDDREPDPDAVEAVKSHLARSRGVLGPAVALVEKVVVDDEHPGGVGYDPLAAALTALAYHYGLKSDSRRRVR